MDQENMVYINNGFSHKKWNLAIFDKTDGLWGQYAKWKKAERQISHDPNCVA